MVSFQAEAGLMIRRFNSPKFRMFLAYFLFAISVIVAFKAIDRIDLFIGFVRQIWGIVTPFFYGFLLAYIINIPCSAVQNLLGKIKLKFVSKRKKGLSFIIVFILTALIIFSILNVVIPYIYESVSYFIENFPTYYARTLEFIEYVNSLNFIEIDASIEGIVAFIQDQLKNFNAQSESLSANTLLGISSAIFGVSSAIFSGVLTLISSIYFLFEKDRIVSFVHRMLKAFASPEVYENIVKYPRSLNRNFKQYINTQTIDGLILGTIATIELFILRSPYALILGIMLGIINYVPYFGSIFGSIVAVLVVAFTQGMLMASITAVVLLITQQIDGNIIQPKLMGSSFKLSPILVIISITVGGAFAGIWGMIAAIPILAVLKDVFLNIIIHYENKKNGDSAGEVEPEEENDEGVL